MSEKYAVHFGAGNIGRGFIGPLLSQSGYHVIFVDIVDHIINALNNEHEYTVHILDVDETKMTVKNFSGVKSTDPAAVDAIVKAEIVTTSVGPEILKRIAPTLAKGIASRRANGKGELTIIACENMVGGTSHLETHVREHLTNDDLEYVKESVGFANCAVDRIVPPFKGDHPLEVGVEGFYEWIVEKENVKGGIVVEGMQLKDHLEPFLERKLYTLNCGHAITGYLGYIKGYKEIQEAIADEEVKRIVHAALHESGNALIRKHGFTEDEHHTYIKKTMTRYANPNIRDELVRIARKPLRKLSPKERLVGPILICKEYGLPTDHLLKGVAAAYYFDAVEDDEAEELVKMLNEKGLDVVIEETTSFPKGSAEHHTVLREHSELKDCKKATA